MQLTLLSMTAMRRVSDGLRWHQLGRRTKLGVIQHGTMNAQQYTDKILVVHVRLYAGATDDRFILMDDNACPHIAHTVQQY